MNLNGLTETQIDAEIYRRSFYEFTKAAWPHVDPSTYVDSKYIEVLCSHAQWVVETGETLVVNIPPRHAKSKIFSVMLNAWVWTRNRKMTFLSSTHSNQLTLRDARLTRQLVKSKWYVEHFGEIVFQADQDTKSRYVNQEFGSRQSVSVGGNVTGDGADIRIADDLLDASDAKTEGALKKVNDYLDEVFSTRIASSTYAPLILVMQRLAVEDASGHLMSQGAKILCLPMSYDPNHVNLSNTPPEAWPKGMQGDWRKAGEMLCPERFSDEFAGKWRRMLGNAATGQLDQNPIPPEGGIFKDELFGTYLNVDASNFSKLIVMADTAEKTGENNAYSVFGLFAKKYNSNDLYVLDLIRFKEEIDGLEKRAVAFFKKHHNKRFNNNPAFSSFQIEDKSSGTQLLQKMRKSYGVTNIERGKDAAGRKIVPPPPSGKWERLDAVADFLRLENSKLMLPMEPTVYSSDIAWTEPYKAELMACQIEMDKVGFWDQADVTSDAGSKLLLSSRKLDASMLGMG